MAIMPETKGGLAESDPKPLPEGHKKGTRAPLRKLPLEWLLPSQGKLRQNVVT